MKINYKTYPPTSGFTPDFHLVKDFLIRLNQSNPVTNTFEWGRWEWVHALGINDTQHLDRIGIWTDQHKQDQIVALATYEDQLGYAYLCIDPQYRFLYPQLIQHAEQHLHKQGALKILISNQDAEFQRLAHSLGYHPTQHQEHISILDILTTDLTHTLPDGYAHITLAHPDFDIKKFHALLWHGFNHEGPPPSSDQDLIDRAESISGPDFDRSLCCIITAPNGDYASFSGIWVHPQTQYALIEPVATHPDHRKKGLGKAAVLTAIQNAAKQGAQQAVVGSNQQFYYQIGFRPTPAHTFWEK